MEDQKIIIITAPSGAGKTSITHYLLKTIHQLAFSISAATRQPRSYEKDQTDYYFISEEDRSNFPSYMGGFAYECQIWKNYPEKTITGKY